MSNVYCKRLYDMTYMVAHTHSVILVEYYYNTVDANIQMIFIWPMSGRLNPIHKTVKYYCI